MEQLTHRIGDSQVFCWGKHMTEQDCNRHDGEVLHIMMVTVSYRLSKETGKQ